jgi:hypothetical protein
MAAPPDAPLLPDLAVADGRTVGWVLGEHLTLARASTRIDCRFDAAIDAIAAAPDRWTIVAGTQVLGIDPASGAVLSALDVGDLDPVSIAVGRELALVRAAPVHHLLHLGQPTEIAIPDAATRARFAAPLATGEGLVWIDLDTIYRLHAGRVPSALGRAPKAEAIAVGPAGATLVQLPDDAVACAPGSLAVRLGQKVDASTARFSLDGATVLAATEDGAAWFDLATGKERESWEGNWLPVGFAPGPLLMDDEGRIHRAGGRVLVRATG